jgi:hypothetical protein
MATPTHQDRGSNQMNTIVTGVYHFSPPPSLPKIRDNDI